MGDLVSQDTGKGKKEEREGQGRNEKNNKKTRTSLVIGHSKKSGSTERLALMSKDVMTKDYSLYGFFDVSQLLLCLTRTTKKLPFSRIVT